MRYVFGPQFAFLLGVKIIPPTPVVPVHKSDVTISLPNPSVENGPLPVVIPAYDVNLFNVLAEIRAYLLPVGTAVPATPEDLVASGFRFESADVSTEFGGAAFDMPLPAVPDGDYVGVTLLGFES